MLKTRTASSLTAALLALALAACVGEQKVTIKLTDAPGDNFEKAVVTISRVYLKGHADGAEGKGDVELRSSPVTTDLLTLANDATDLVKEASVPTGTYKELRFVITGAYIQVKEDDGTRRIYATSPDYAGLPGGAQVDGALQMPSAAASGLKVKFDQDADVSVTSEGDQQVILVDFDVAQSFGRQAGGSGRWVMGPVIKGADLALSGNVKVTLQPAQGVALSNDDAAQLRAVLVNADGSREPLAFTPAADGGYVADFKYLLPGTYGVDLESAAGASFSTDPGLPANATVGSGAEAQVAFSLTAFSPLER